MTSSSTFETSIVYDIFAKALHTFHDVVRVEVDRRSFSLKVSLLKVQEPISTPSKFIFFLSKHVDFAVCHSLELSSLGSCLV